MTQLCLKRNLNVSDLLNIPQSGRKMSKRLVGGIIGCKYKTSSWHLNGLPDGRNIDWVNSTIPGRNPPLCCKLTFRTRRLNLSRETKFSGTHGDRGILIFPVQLTTSRIGNRTWLIHSLLLYVMTIHTLSYRYIHAVTPDKNKTKTFQYNIIK